MFSLILPTISLIVSICVYFYAKRTLKKIKENYNQTIENRLLKLTLQQSLDESRGRLIEIIGILRRLKEFIPTCTQKEESETLHLRALAAFVNEKNYYRGLQKRIKSI